MKAPVIEGEVLWRPSPEFAAATNERAFARWLEARSGLELDDYHTLWRWSVESPEDFWCALWDYFEIEHDGTFERAIDRRVMPGAGWFVGTRVNYAEHLLRHARKVSPDAVALHHLSETRGLETTSWGELNRQVRVLATRLREMGIGPGDRVVSYMPNLPETAVAMMATLAIGAVWSSAAPEFGVKAVIDRFSQIEPKLLFAADGYRFNGKEFTRHAEAEQILRELPSLEQVVWLPYLGTGEVLKDPRLKSWSGLLHGEEAADFQFERVPHDHPLWILFSSGTTGVPKAIVHGHGGVLIEHLKLTHFHMDLKPGDVMFFYSTTGWVMWNILLSALLTGASAVLYDGSPVFPAPDLLWDIAARTRTTNFGASPMFVQMMEKAGLEPGRDHDLSALRSVLVSGAPSTPETFAWLYRCVKGDLWVTSQSGGTEIASGFVGASPTLPVRAGEIQAPMLGMNVQAWGDAGNSVLNEVGDLVVLSPFPSAPIFFWNDEGGKRYHDSYFATFAGVWCHGDFLKINEHGGCYIYGRSDSTLNRHGVRIGTAEVYRCVEDIPGIAGCLVVCFETAPGHDHMPMFVKTNEGVVLDVPLRKAIARKLKADCSPRHVPDEIIAVPEIPFTLTGKKMEVPVRKLLSGWPMEKVASRDAMLNPTAIDWFVDFAKARSQRSAG